MLLAYLPLQSDMWSMVIHGATLTSSVNICIFSKYYIRLKFHSYSSDTNDVYLSEIKRAWLQWPINQLPHHKHTSKSHGFLLNTLRGTSFFLYGYIQIKAVIIPLQCTLLTLSCVNDGNNEPQFPEEDIPENVDSVNVKPHSLVDWRDFRASLVAHKYELLDTGTVASHKAPNMKLGHKWAHPIPIPEPGCVLVATEKLDGVSSFERTVVLLLKLGTRDPREGPFGVIINRPLHKKIKNTNPSNADLANTFAECPVHFGGPLDTSMFLVRNSNKLPLPGLEEVVSGICFGARNSLEGAAELVKKRVLEAEDFKFFVGYAGWQYDQLREEIKSGYWVVAACSSYLIGRDALMESSSIGLWEEILQLMGGRYSEMSRKPRKDNY